MDQALNEAHADHVKRLFVVLVANLTDAAGDAAKIRDAEEKFKRGLALGRDAFDRAMAIVNAA